MLVEWGLPTSLFPRNIPGRSVFHSRPGDRSYSIFVVEIDDYKIADCPLFHRTFRTED